MRLIIMALREPARAPRPSTSPTTSTSRSPRATLPANVSKGTPLGIEAAKYMDAGDYVPDEVTNLMVRDRIDEDDAKPGFLLDGYPRIANPRSKSSTA